MEEARLNCPKDEQVSECIHKTTLEKKKDASEQDLLRRKDKKMLVGTSSTNPSDSPKPLRVRRGIDLKIVVKGPEIRNPQASAVVENRMPLTNRSSHRRSAAFLDPRFSSNTRNHIVTQHAAPISYSRPIVRDLHLHQQYLHNNHHYQHHHYQEQYTSCRTQRRTRSKLTPRCKEIV